MKISQKGLYALQALMMLARHYNQGAIRIRDVAYEEDLPEKFLELILLEMKNARIVESVRGAKGGYQLRRPPGEIRLSEIIRLIDGPLAPFGDAEQLRSLIDRDAEHRALYQVFLDVAMPQPRFSSTLRWLTLLGRARNRPAASARKNPKKPLSCRWWSMEVRGAKMRSRWLCGKRGIWVRTVWVLAVLCLFSGVLRAQTTIRVGAFLNIT